MPGKSKLPESHSYYKCACAYKVVLINLNCWKNRAFEENNCPQKC